MGEDRERLDGEGLACWFLCSLGPAQAVGWAAAARMGDLGQELCRVGQLGFGLGGQPAACATSVDLDAKKKISGRIVNVLKILPHPLLPLFCLLSFPSTLHSLHLTSLPPCIFSFLKSLCISFLFLVDAS